MSAPVSSTPSKPDTGPERATARPGERSESHLQDVPRPRGDNRPAGGGRSSIQPVELEETGNPSRISTPSGGPGMETPTTVPDLFHGQRPRTVDPSAKSACVARLSGQSLRFPAGTRLIPGETAIVAGRAFDIRSAGTFTMRFWLQGTGLVMLVALAAVCVSYMSGEPPRGSVIGVVVDANSGRIIPGADVTSDNGPTVQANAAGLYSINNMTTGLFTLTASAPGYSTQSGTVIRQSGENGQLAFALVPLETPVNATERTKTAPVTDATSGDASDADLSTAASGYGNIALNVDFDDFLVFVDDVIYGKNARKLKRMPSGTHKIVLQLDGFEDYATTIDVKARTTATITVAKSDLTPKANPLHRAKGHFALAKGYQEKNMWPQAIEALNAGLALDPQNADALQDRGWARLKSNDAAGARTDFLAAAQLHKDANRYLNAVACAGYLIDMDRGKPDGYMRRAGYYLAMSEYAKAINDYEQAVKFDKKSAANQMALGEACFASGDYRRAAKEFDKARKLSDDPSTPFVRLLISLSKAGEDDQVRKKYKEFSGVATPDRLKQLRTNPDWLRVLQIVDPSVRSEG